MNTTNYINQKKAVLYCRVSTKEQVDEGNSLSTQEKICRDYATKNDYDVASVFVEQGESAKTADRTELKKLLNYCADKKHDIKAVIIYKLDRLSRSTDDYSYIRLFLKRYGVEIKSTTEHFDNNPVGRFMENTMANIAQFDNDIRAERCAGGMKDAMRDGRYVWMAPIGYDNIKVAGRATIGQNIVMGPLMLKTFELVARNIYPTEEVRQIMTKEGLLNKKGSPLSKGYFYAMLTNEVYSGWIIKFGEKHKGHFEPIVSDELFSQVQRVLKNKGRKHSQYLTDNPDFPLRRFVFSPEGKRLTGSWSSGRAKKYPFYRFEQRGSNFNKEKFEITYKEFMDRYKLDDKHINRLKELVRENLIKATVDQRKEVEGLKKYINELTNKQSSIIAKNLDGVINDTVLKQQLAIIDKELLEANASLSNMPENEVDFEKVIDFTEDYLREPSKFWSKAKIKTQLKLQWFQFPLGLTFDGKIFGTTEIASVFKTKDAFSASLSSKVDRTGLEPATPSLQMMCSTR